MSWLKKFCTPWVVMSLFAIMYFVKWKVLKMPIGTWANSPSLVADAYHNLKDFVDVGFLSIFGIWVANMPKSDNYPEGLRKVAALITLMISCALGYLALYTTFKSLLGFLSLAPVWDQGLRSMFPDSFLPLVEKPLVTSEAFIALISVTGLCAILSFGMARYEEYVGRKVGNISLIADSKETFGDGLIEISGFLAYTSKFALIYLFSDKLPETIEAIGSIIEYGLGIGISIIIAFSAWELRGLALNILLDHSIGDDHVKRIKEIAARIEGIENVDMVVTCSNGAIASCRITVTVPKEGMFHGPIKYALTKHIKEYLDSSGDFLGSEIYCLLEPSTSPLIREADAIYVSPDGKEIVVQTVAKAEYLRIYDMDKHGQRHRATDEPLEGLSEDELIGILKEKKVKRIFVFKGDPEEKALFEAHGIEYSLSSLLRCWVPIIHYAPL